MLAYMSDMFSEPVADNDTASGYPPLTRPDSYSIEGLRALVAETFGADGTAVAAASSEALATDIDHSWESCEPLSAMIRRWIDTSGRITADLLRDPEYQRLCALSAPATHLHGDADGDALICVDEGVPDAWWRIAGGGLGALIDDVVFQALAERISAAHGRLAVIPHGGCGAAKYFVEQVLDLSGFDQRQLDAITISLVRLLVDRLQTTLPNLAIEAGAPIPIEQLSRPAGYHDAIGIVCDLWSGATPAHLARLPKSFKISELPLPEHDLNPAARTLASLPGQLGLCASLAFGPFGFGGRFSVEAPLHIMLVHDATAGGIEHAEHMARLALGQLQQTGNDTNVVCCSLVDARELRP